MAGGGNKTSQKVNNNNKKGNFLQATAGEALTETSSHGGV